MFSVKRMLFGERSVTKVAGLFASRPDAEQAVLDLLEVSMLSIRQISMLGPLDGQASRSAVLDRAIEPEQRGIWLTVIRAHVTLGAVGFLAGAGLYAVLIALGNPALLSTPGMGFVALAGFGTVFGMILGGALALRPDHGRVIALVRRGLESGKWAVVAHPLDAGQTHLAVAALTNGSLRVVRSF